MRLCRLQNTANALIDGRLCADDGLADLAERHEIPSSRAKSLPTNYLATRQSPPSRYIHLKFTAGGGTASAQLVARLKTINSPEPSHDFVPKPTIDEKNHTPNQRSVATLCTGRSCAARRRSRGIHRGRSWSAGNSIVCRDT